MRLLKRKRGTREANRGKRTLRIASALVASVAVVAAVALTTAAAKQSKDEESTTAVAVFKSASPLVPGNEIQINGVKVGTIEDIKLVRNTAHVVMRLDPGVLPLHNDARAQIRPVSLLGERYIELNTGTPSAPAMEDEQPTIPLHRTDASVDLDEVLNSLDDPTSTALASLVTTLGEGGAGRGKDAAAAFKALKPTMSEAGQLADVLNQQNDMLGRMVAAAQKSTSAAAADNGKKLDHLLGSAQRTLATTARNREALNATLNELPTTLASAKRTLAELGGVADSTTPALRSMRPATHNLKEISGELQNFSDAADPALGSLPPVLNRLNKMLDEARPVLRDMKPAASGLNKAVGHARPITDGLINHKPGQPSALENLMDGVGDWAMTTNGYDGISHYFRGILVGTTDSLFTGVNGQLPGDGNLLPANTDPDEPGKDGHLPVPDMPVLKDGKLPLMPGLVPHPQNPIGQDPGTMPGLPLPLAPSPKQPNEKQHNQGNRSADPNNATGLTPEQESSMLDQLIGGGR